MALAEFVEGDVDAELGVVVHLDPHRHDGVEVGVEHAAVEAVLRDAEPHRAAELVGRLVDAHLVAPASQVVGARHAGGSTPDDADRLGPVGHGRSLQLAPQVAVVLLGTVLLGEESLEGSDRDRTIDLAASAGVLTRSGAHPAAHRGERVRQLGRHVCLLVVAVRDGGDVHAGVGVDRTRRQARDVLVVELEFEHQMRSSRWAYHRPPMTAARPAPQSSTPIRSCPNRSRRATSSRFSAQSGR